MSMHTSLRLVERNSATKQLFFSRCSHKNTYASQALLSIVIR